jgi:L-threonylcarbamoyladenylate synthase
MISRSELRRAAELLRRGELVAFPTETVYGLGANALDPEAVARIYQVKGRPSTSPLIVHVDSIEMARALAAEWPDTAAKLAALWWPGPLTLVLPKRAIVPDIVTAGLPAVGLRMPAAGVALDLIGEAGVPVAAPSANRFGELSPTTAEHVRRSLGDKVAMILDGGPAEVGIESTVVSLAGPKPILLRPGQITRQDIESLAGPVEVQDRAEGSHPAPGMHARHYSPTTPLLLVDRGSSLPSEGRGAWLYLSAPRGCAREISMPDDAAAYARVLYARLHELDLEGLDWIAVEQPPDTAGWAAVLDRLRRAACK